MAGGSAAVALAVPTISHKGADAVGSHVSPVLGARVTALGSEVVKTLLDAAVHKGSKSAMTAQV